MARFEKLLPEYVASPQVTRERLYLETMEQVYGNTSKVLVDVKNGNNIMYLPLDKMLNQAGGAAQPAAEPRINLPENRSVDSVTQSPRVDSNRAGRG